MHSVLMHALNAVLLFLLLVWMTKRAGPSILVAALFAVHPLNVESVAWVAERKSVLSTLYFFLTSSRLRVVREKAELATVLPRGGPVAAALMAKPMVVYTAICPAASRLLAAPKNASVRRRSQLRRHDPNGVVEAGDGEDSATCAFHCQRR